MPEIEVLRANEMSEQQMAEKALAMCDSIQGDLLGRLNGDSLPNLHDIYAEVTALHITLQFLAGKRGGTQ